VPSSAIITATEKVAAAENVAQIREAILGVADAYGFSFVGLLRQPKPNEDLMSLVLIERMPKDWAAHYIRKKFVLIDPTIRYLGHAQRGFRWSDTVRAHLEDPQFRRMERMMGDARKFGLEDGYVFPVHGRRGLVGNMTLGGPVVELSEVEISLFDGLAKIAFWHMLEMQDPDVSRRLSAAVDVKMTHREMEALHYLSDGMTSPEIANVLDISNHTVDWYMNGIQQKLNAKNRHHAVAIAFRLGLIS
jgi:LuxR family transcriptional regulator, quorum-sensing system regulator SdiA